MRWSPLNATCSLLCKPRIIAWLTYETTLYWISWRAKRVLFWKGCRRVGRLMRSKADPIHSTFSNFAIPASAMVTRAILDFHFSRDFKTKWTEKTSIIGIVSTNNVAGRRTDVGHLTLMEIFLFFFPFENKNNGTQRSDENGKVPKTVSRLFCSLLNSSSSSSRTDSSLDTNTSAFCLQQIRRFVRRISA